MVEEGLKDPIVVDDLAEKDWLYLRRGIFLTKNQVEMIFLNLSKLLEYSYYNADSKKVVLEFIDHIFSKPKLKTFVEEKLKDYEAMTYQSKMKLLKELLTEMMKDKQDEKGENDEIGQSYQWKTYLDILSNKVQLIYALINFHLK